MKNLPPWAVYLITGLGAVVLLLAGVSGTLINSDRVTITKSMEKLEVAINQQNLKHMELFDNQNKQITELMKHNDRQNHVMEKICVALTMDHKQRMEAFKNYPLNK